MANNISEEEIRRAVTKVMHPEIGHTLAEPEMTKEIPVNDNRVVLTAAFPSLVVPIRDFLVHSVQEMVMKLGGDFQLKIKGKCL